VKLKALFMVIFMCLLCLSFISSRHSIDAEIISVPGMVRDVAKPPRAVMHDDVCGGHER